MTDIVLSNIDLAIIRETFKRPKGLPVWMITGTLGFSLKDAAHSFRKLRDLGFVGEIGGTVRLLALGRSWVFANQEKFAFSGKKPWRKVPQEFLSSKTEPFRPYAPRVSSLDKSKFPFGRSR